ncbi:MAG TPA: hypothetical protein VKB57_23625 [Acidimicrobiales bacterium]|nr:hypothetical protein [Acidimicrobiales bacterium]
MAVTLTATLDAGRLAARLQVDGVPAGADTYTITRTSPSGSKAGVRGAVNATVAIPTQIARDYELPFDVALTYTVTVYDGATVVGTATTTFTLTYGECPAWLVDLARPTNSLPLTIESMDELQFAAAVGVHRILNRRAPVLTSLPAWTPSSELIVLTDTLGERDQTRALLGSGYPFLLRTTPAQGIGNMYLGVTDFTEERFLRPGVAPERRFKIEVVQVERPDPSIYVPLAPNTYANVKATFATYAALKAAVGTYDQLAYTYPAGTNPVTPWLPDDV